MPSEAKPQQTEAPVDAPVELQAFLRLITGNEEGFSLGEPWKYSEDALAVVVPILRPDAPDREYITMYEVLKELDIKDTGSINVVELQSKVDKPIFVRAGTIFTGKTQSRAAQNSGVYQKGTINIDVKCVHQSHGISRGAKMEFGDIAPPSVTMNLMSQADQRRVWNSVHKFTRGGTGHGETGRDYGGPFTPIRDIQDDMDMSAYREDFERLRAQGLIEDEDEDEDDPLIGANFIGYMTTEPEPEPEPRRIRAHHRRTMGLMRGPRIGAARPPQHRRVRDSPENIRSDDLLGHLKKRDEGRALLDEMMQKVPLFDGQAGAVLFNPVGVVAVECFDHPESWKAIKKEVIEKLGNKIMKEQAEHLFELQQDKIPTFLDKFIDKLTNHKERTIRKDSFTETRIIVGDGLVGEYTIVLGRVVHVLLTRDVNGK